MTEGEAETGPAREAMAIRVEGGSCGGSGESGVRSELRVSTPRLSGEGRTRIPGRRSWNATSIDFGASTSRSTSTKPHPNAFKRGTTRTQRSDTRTRIPRRRSRNAASIDFGASTSRSTSTNQHPYTFKRGAYSYSAQRYSYSYSNSSTPLLKRGVDRFRNEYE